MANDQLVTTLCRSYRDSFLLWVNIYYKRFDVNFHGITFSNNTADQMSANVCQATWNEPYDIASPYVPTPNLNVPLFPHKPAPMVPHPMRLPSLSSYGTYPYILPNSHMLLLGIFNYLDLPPFLN